MGTMTGYIGYVLIAIILAVWYWRENLKKDTFRCGMWVADDDFLEEAGLGSLHVYFRPNSLMVLMSDLDGNVLVSEDFDYKYSGDRLTLDRKCPMMAKTFELDMKEDDCCMTLISDGKMYARLFKDGESTMIAKKNRKLISN